LLASFAVTVAKTEEMHSNTYKQHQYKKSIGSIKANCHKSVYIKQRISFEYVRG